MPGTLYFIALKNGMFRISQLINLIYEYRYIEAAIICDALKTEIDYILNFYDL